MIQNKVLKLHDLKEEHENLSTKIYGRVSAMRNTKNICFMILRDRIKTLQCVINKKNVNEFKEYCSIELETVIIVTGQFIQLPKNIVENKTTFKNYEFIVTEIIKISSPEQKVPFLLDDVNNLYNKIDNKCNVQLSTRLDHRAFDLRAPFNNCIFTIQSAVSNLFREYLLSQEFIEIHSPKIIGTPSEGGAAVFNINYFKTNAFLAQSPQLYKQMCINSDFNRVFEIGPVFRAENSFSNRHLCEFTGLDLEMALSPITVNDDKSFVSYDYHEIITTFWNMLVFVFNGLKEKYSEQLSYIQKFHVCEEFKFPKEPLIIDFKKGVKLLNCAGYDQKEMDDLTTQNEKKLGEIVKQLYDSDLFVLDKYPLVVRPFYTMPCESDYSNSFDVIMRGQEISSGSQRIHNYSLLMEKIKEHKLDPTHLNSYLESFRYGSVPHGGCGFGLERIVMLYFNLDNIRETSLYPRDPSRTVP